MALEINSVIKTPRSLTIIGTGALLFVLVGYFFIKLDKKQHKSSKKQHQQVEQSDTTTAIKTIDQEESHVVVEPSLVEIVKVEPIKEEEMTKNKKVVKTTVSSSHDDDQTVPTSAPPAPQPVKLESDKVAPVDLKDNTESVVSVPKLESSKIEEHSDKKVDSESKVTSNTVENQVPSSKSKSKKKNKSELESAPAKPVVNTTNVTKPSTNVSNAVPVSKKASKAKKLEATVSNKLLVETSDKSYNSDSLYEDIVVYEFNFPRKLCGKLIGRNGVHVDQIRAKTHTQIAVRNDPTTDDLQIVCVSGRVEEVDQALEMITQRFPAKIYPEISFKPISKPIKYRRSKNMDVLIGGTPQNVDHDAKVFVAPQSMFVDLMNVMPHTINTEESKEPVTYTEEELAEMAINIHVTSVVNTGHVFIQVPSNPMYENLEKLDVAMLNAYSILDDEKEIPLMKEPIDFGTICAAPTSYGWHRAMVVDYTPKEELNGEECGVATIKFLDYGGYLTLPTNQLRQLRSDFMLLPFQAIECYLDGIFPYEDKLEKGKTFLYNLIKNSVIKAVLTGYAEDGLPLLTLFITNELYQNNNLNNELIKYNFAYSVNHQEQDSFTESFSLSDTDQSFHKDHTGMLNEQTIH